MDENGGTSLLEISSHELKWVFADTGSIVADYSDGTATTSASEFKISDKQIDIKLLAGAKSIQVSIPYIYAPKGVFEAVFKYYSNNQS